MQRGEASAALPSYLDSLIQEERNKGRSVFASSPRVLLVPLHKRRSETGEAKVLLHCVLAPGRELCSTTGVPSRLQYCVYVLLSMHENGFYIGFTTDLQRRLTEHFLGESKATAPRRPFRLIFCEYFFSKEDAERREGYLKTTAGRKGLKLVLRETLKSRVWD